MLSLLIVLHLTIHDLVLVNLVLVGFNLSLLDIPSYASLWVHILYVPAVLQLKLYLLMTVVILVLVIREEIVLANGLHLGRVF